MPSGTKVANGNIKPSRAVKYDTSADGKVLQAGTGDKVYGVSGPGTRRPGGDYVTDDGYHAIATENCMVYVFPEKDVYLCLGGTVAAGDRLKVDSDGCGVTTTSTGDEIFAEASVAGTAGKVIPVRLLSPGQY